MYRSDELNALGLELQNWLDEHINPVLDDDQGLTVIVCCTEFASLIDVDDVTVWHSEVDEGDVDLDFLKDAWIRHCKRLRVFADMECSDDTFENE